MAKDFAGWICRNQDSVDKCLLNQLIEFGGPHIIQMYEESSVSYCQKWAKTSLRKYLKYKQDLTYKILIALNFNIAKDVAIIIAYFV